MAPGTHSRSPGEFEQVQRIGAMVVTSDTMFSNESATHGRVLARHMVPTMGADGRCIFAVGTRVTSRPPPRSVRAAFPHTAPTSGIVVLIGQHRLTKAIGFGNLPFCRLILSVTYPKRDWGADLAMPEWLDRALIGVLVALAASFFWGCITSCASARTI
jgi:hypothetical protein